MRKLNIRKIKWIVKEVERRDMGVWTIAKQQKITPRWARELPRKYKGEEIVLKKPGRKPKPIPDNERKIVIDTYNEYLVGATMIERILDEKGQHIGHNKIHKILLKAKLAKREENKQRRRKYKCYERKHSNSLWHTDWLEFRGTWYIMFEDDASRFVTSSGEFQNRSSENAWKVFKKALTYGVPKQSILITIQLSKQINKTKIIMLNVNIKRKSRLLVLSRFLQDQDIQEAMVRMKSSTGR